ncbi:hypothetical protein IJT93_07210 [bacterium]|nr:hypothetical protein [bacterium]
MLLERTGKIIEFYDDVTTELFGTTLVDGAKSLDLRYELDSEQNCINEASESICNFFIDIDFEFSKEDGNTIMQCVKDKVYCSHKNAREAFIAVSPNKLVSYINIRTLGKKILKIYILADRLEKSPEWRSAGAEQKKLLFDDLFKAKKTQACL